LRRFDQIIDPKKIDMKKISALLFFCFLIGTSSTFAQSADEKTIADRIENLRKAMLSPNKSVLEESVADQLSYGHSSGLIEDKAAFVEDIVSGKTVFTAIDFSNQTIRIVDNIAIVRHHMTGATNNNNVPVKIDIIVLQVWQKQNTVWKLIARQAAKIPEVKPN